MSRERAIGARAAAGRYLARRPAGYRAGIRLVLAQAAV